MNARMMMAFCCSLLLAAAASDPVSAQVDLGPVTAEGQFEGGGFVQPVPYTEVAKFQEYRDLAQQLIAPQLELLLGDKKQDFYFNFNAINTAQTNEMYNLRFGEYGLLDVQAQWQEIPHAFSTGVARTPYLQNGGDFTLGSRPAAPAPGAPAGQNVQNWVDSTARPIDLSLLEGISNLNVRYMPAAHWTLSVNFNYQNPTGQQPYGGSFLFGPNPGNFNINELFVPTQTYTYNYGAGAEYARNGWVLGFQYQGSFFHNSVGTLSWDNPDTWGNAHGPSGQCIDSAAYSPSAGTGPCRGEAQMYPDNQAHNFIVTAAGSLPLRTHVMANLEYGFWLQNQPFIPFTTNSALAQPLTRGSLGGDVRPFFANIAIDSNPIERLTLKAAYSYYDYDNQTPPITFTNVKSLNDVASSWTATAYPFAFSTQNVNLEPTYRISETLAAHFIANIDTYHNGGLMVLQQDQTSYGPALDWSPRSWLTFGAVYQHAFRDSPGYNNNRNSLVQQNAGTTELAALQRFDEATVYVNQTSLYGQAQVGKGIGLYAGFDYDDYNYPSSVIGLQHTSSYSPSVGVSYDPMAGIHIFGDYSWQAYDWNLRAMQRQSGGAAPGCPSNPDLQTPFNCPAQTWTGNGRDQGNSIDFGMDIAIPTKWFLRSPSHFKVQYTYVVGNDTIHSHGDSAFAPGAAIFPDTGNQFQELIVQYRYMIAKNTWINIGYYFSHFGEFDFGVDNVRNWESFAPSSTFLGNTTIDPYDANVAFITLQYKF